MAELLDRSRKEDLAPGDNLPLSDSGDSNNFVRTTVEDVSDYVLGQVPEQKSFDNTQGNIATWAEGNNTDQIPSSKLDLSTVTISGAVLTTGNQSIDGVKDFSSAPRHNGVGFVELGNDQTISGDKTFTGDVTVEGTLNFGTTGNLVVNGDLGVTGGVTLGETAALVDAFLTNIEDEGGRTDFTIGTYAGVGVVSSGEIGVYRVGEDTGLFDGIGVAFEEDSYNYTPALENYLLVYLDINNWWLFESAARENDDLGADIFYATSVIASQGGYQNGQTVSVYQSTTNFDIEGFINFFDTSTPVDTPYDQSGEAMSQLIRDADDVVLIDNIAGSYEIQSGGNRVFNFFSDDFVTGDIIRLRIYAPGDDKDSEASVPVLDVRKQILLSGSFVANRTGTYNGEAATTTDPNINFLVFTVGADEINDDALTDTPLIGASTVYFFSEEQLRIDRSSQVQAEAFSDPSNILVDGRADVRELEVEGQFIVNNLQAFDPLVENKLYTQTAAQLGGTGTTRVICISDGPIT